MRPVTVRTADLKNIIINLGFVGENEHRQIRFDAKKDFEEYPNASASLTVVPPEGESYPAIIERDGDFVLWTITDSDVIGEGDGEIQLAFTEGEVVKRTCIGRTKTDRSLVPTGSIPSGIDDFITRAGTLLEQVEETFPAGGTTGQVLAKKSDTDYDTEWVDQGGGTEDYDELENRPQIGGVTLTGNKTLHELGAASEVDVDAKYTKPAGGIPASDIADGVIQDPEDLIDDTAGEGDTDKVWSADKSHELLTEINSKADEPTGTKSAGKVYGLDSNLAPVWVDGGAVDPQEIAEAVDTWCESNITNPSNPPLDRSLSTQLSAAPADIVGSLNTFCRKEVTTVAKGNYSATAGVDVPSQTHLVNITIPNGKAYKFKLEGNSHVTKYHLYSSAGALKYNCDPDTEYDLTASSELTYISVYVQGANVSSSGTITGIVTMTSETSGSLEEQIDDVRNYILPLKNAFSGDIKVYADTYEVGAEVNNSGNATYIYHDFIFDLTQSEAIGVLCSKIEGVTYNHPLVVQQLDSSNESVFRAEYSVEQVLADMIKVFPVATATKAKVTLYCSSTGGLTTSTAKYHHLTIFTSNNGQLLIEDRHIPSKYEIPIYYHASSYIDNKIDTIEGLMNDAEGNYDAFIFCTDEHWSLNAKQSPRLINYICDRLNIPRMFMGGDYDNGIDLDALKAYRDCFKGKMYNVTGNHEYMNYITPIGGELTSKTIEDGDIWAYLNMGMTDAVNGNFGRNYYYVDNEMQKMRYIILNVYADNGNAAQQSMEEAQRTWFANTALDLPSGYTAVIFVHYMYMVNYNTGAMTISTEGGYIQTIVDAYNGDGKIAAIFAGHTHVDGMTTTAGGVPVFVTTCDKYYPWIEGSTDMEPWLTANRTKGTITEQAFDVVIVDKTNKKVSCVRIGAPADNGTSDKLEVRYQNYT